MHSSPAPSGPMPHIMARDWERGYRTGTVASMSARRTVLPSHRRDAASILREFDSDDGVTDAGTPSTIAALTSRQRRNASHDHVEALTSTPLVLAAYL